MYVPFDVGDRPLRPRQRTARRRWLASINTPLFPGLGNFAAQRSRGMAQRAKGKFLLNGVVATRQGPRRQVARQERLQWGEAVSPKGTHAKSIRFERATLAGRNLRHEQAGVWAETFAGRSSPAGAHFGKRYGVGVQSPRAGLTAQLTGRAETARATAPETRGACLCGESRLPRGERWGSACVWLQNVV
jgi:hypothetical protein